MDRHALLCSRDTSPAQKLRRPESLQPFKSSLPHKHHSNRHNHIPVSTKQPKDYQEQASGTRRQVPGVSEDQEISKNPGARNSLGGQAAPQTKLLSGSKEGHNHFFIFLIITICATFLFFQSQNPTSLPPSSTLSAVALSSS